MEILIITGLSGGGKSRAASYLEDIGYYTVDNLPAEMMVKFADFCAGSSGRYDRVALVYDVRSGEPTDILIETLERLKASGVNCRMLFLEADNQTIVNRYKETRRMHPLQKKGESVEQAIRREREWMQPVRDHADFVLDTSALSIAKLRSCWTCSASRGIGEDWPSTSCPSASSTASPSRRIWCSMCASCPTPTTCRN